MLFKTEQELTTFAENLGRTLEPPLVFELIGDVGAGKTTFTRALAKGLGIKAPVTSPSFTICNRYEWSAQQKRASHRGATPVGNFELIHYDFYRLENPGLMLDDLQESLTNPSAIVILEWANSVKNILPKDHITITFRTLEDGSRDLQIKGLKNELIS
ncbi:tRNA (adenosine(37)-N6)-threonylcarbamoyltransferase complex ATPase subunit type 1 TsaE [Candidatus Saccharibacteria bacterium]|nr:tRNA (adenosine(37)-N6)-threonylcarbamoyltransferase complex ATPase subunit type 1 TsaE [Candidatus Saccharibacteria bacterium]MBR6123000.1 tRNA (adenosine(37)-N6)-threonylcarbamoyltransferase complex ATPase subunit type 1 TsaE [Candidatus Saccharibacteria bacterium]